MPEIPDMSTNVSRGDQSEHQHSINPYRRLRNKVASIVVAGVLLGGVMRGIVERDEVQKYLYSLTRDSNEESRILAHLEAQNSFEDPVIKGASFTVMNDSMGFNSGSGGIITDNYGNLSLASVNHITNSDNTVWSFGRVPYTNKIHILEGEFVIYPGAPRRESSDYYPSGDFVTRLPFDETSNAGGIYDEVSRGDIMPSRIYAGEVKHGEIVAIPNKKDQQINFSRIVGVHNGYIEVESMYGELYAGCQGYSGSPVLLVDKTGKVLPETIGVVGSGKTNVSDNCGTHVSVLPFK